MPIDTVEGTEVISKLIRTERAEGEDSYLLLKNFKGSESDSTMENNERDETAQENYGDYTRRTSGMNKWNFTKSVTQIGEARAGRCWGDTRKCSLMSLE